MNFKQDHSTSEGQEDSRQRVGFNHSWVLAKRIQCIDMETRDSKHMK